MSRPGKGIDHVESLDGDAFAKARLRAVLQTIAGELSVEEACLMLSMSPSRFHELREEALKGAMRALEPKTPGRPPSPAPDPKVTALERENSELKRDLEAARIRTEIAIVMPHVLRPLKEGEKGGPRPKRDARDAT
jgi:hypothetical protein